MMDDIITLKGEEVDAVHARTYDTLLAPSISSPLMDGTATLTLHKSKTTNGHAAAVDFSTWGNILKG